MEAESFVAPGHLPPRRNYSGPPPRHPPHFPHPHQPPSHRHHPYSQPFSSPRHHQGPQIQAEASWMTPEIRAELNVRNRLKASSQDSPEDHRAYQDQCKKVQQMIDQSKASRGLPTQPTGGSGGSNATINSGYPFPEPCHPHNPNYPPPNPSYPSVRPGYPPPDPNFPPPNPSYPSANSGYPSPDPNCPPPNPPCPSANPGYHPPNPSHPSPNPAYPTSTPDAQLSRDPATLEAIAAYYRDPSNYYTQMAPRKVYTCEPCNRTYFSKRMMDKHLGEHVECPFPECKLSAHAKVIDQHINNQHMLVNFANLQIDDETWIAERKKRFPTAQRAEMRRAELLEKIKRGEKLGKSTKPFAKKQGKYGKQQKIIKTEDSWKAKEENQGKGKGGNISQTRGGGEVKGANRNEAQKGKVQDEGSKVSGEGKVEAKGRRGVKRKKRERPPPRPRAHLDVDLFESDEDDEDRLPPFQGTRHFYESTGELSYFGNRNPDIVDSDEEGTVQENGDDMGISDDDDWPVESKDEKAGSGGLMLGGALGSLMAAYSGSEDEDDGPPALQEIIRPVQTTDNPVPKSSQTPHEPSNTEADEKGGNEDGKTVVTKEMGEHKGTRTRRRQRHHKKAQPNKQAKVRKFPRRRKTLLEKLLQPDIVHERNVILQCVRYIVGNNFFDDCDDRGNEVETEQKEKGETGEVHMETEAGMGGKVRERETEKEVENEQEREETDVCVDNGEKVEQAEGRTKVQKETLTEACVGNEVREIHMENEVQEMETEADMREKVGEMCTEKEVGNEQKREETKMCVDDGGREAHTEKEEMREVQEEMVTEACVGEKVREMDTQKETGNEQKREETKVCVGDGGREAHTEKEEMREVQEIETEMGEKVREMHTEKETGNEQKREETKVCVDDGEKVEQAEKGETGEVLVEMQSEACVEKKVREMDTEKETGNEPEGEEARECLGDAVKERETEGESEVRKVEITEACMEEGIRDIEKGETGNESKREEARECLGDAMKERQTEGGGREEVQKEKINEACMDEKEKEREREMGETGNEEKEEERKECMDSGVRGGGTKEGETDIQKAIETDKCMSDGEREHTGKDVQKDKEIERGTGKTESMNTNDGDSGEGIKINNERVIFPSEVEIESRVDRNTNREVEKETDGKENAETCNKTSCQMNGVSGEDENGESEGGDEISLP